MLAALLYSIWPYQIFKSVVFRSGMTFLTVYWVVVWGMPLLIRWLRHAGMTSDFKSATPGAKPYTGAPPIMGGGMLVLGILAATILWTDLNQYIVALMAIMLSFGLIGGVDDWAKVRHRRRVDSGTVARQHHADKADGISGRLRLTAEFGVALLTVLGLYLFVDIDGHLTVPFVPMKDWYPYLPRFIFIPLMVFIIVGGANAVNLTDGMDSLATVPLMTCALFVGAVAYVGGDEEFAARLKIPHLTHDVKELTILAAGVLSAGLAFLKFNSPPALIYMGDLGALALGSLVSTMFIFVKAELFLPIVGGIFVFAALSTLIQRGFFQLMLRWKGRATAERYRFFLRAPYHHHLQRLWTYSDKQEVQSVWLLCLRKVGIDPVPEENKLLNPHEVNSRVIWHVHLKSIWLFVISIIIYFKIR
ncbi:MAG: phospho-N-acetylmuramoyl-pentapeptide-transferase [bacterium]